MDKDRIKGKAEEIKGKVKEKAGEWTGNKETEAEGLLDQAKGKARNTVGKVKDAGRDAMDKINEKPRPEIKKEEIRREVRDDGTTEEVVKREKDEEAA
ncbi:MAG TPA: CsbD family protein [Candidatus Angelobacter sp.]|nr:CsbD family protein [Candidatus Angelobacter sp.]